MMNHVAVFHTPARKLRFERHSGEAEPVRLLNDERTDSTAILQIALGSVGLTNGALQIVDGLVDAHLRSVPG